MMWTIIDSDTGAVIWPCLFSDVNPEDNPTWAWESNHLAVEISAAPDPARHVWDGTAWVDDLTMAQARKWTQVKALREEKLQLAPTPLGVAQSDIASMVKINGLVSMAMLAKSASAAYSETFTMADNSEVVMDADQMIGFGVAVGSHIAAVHARGRDLRAAIDAAATVEDLEAVDITAGWP